MLSDVVSKLLNSAMFQNWQPIDITRGLKVIDIRQRVRDEAIRISKAAFKYVVMEYSYLTSNHV